jgi:hypothetical protein
LSWFLAVNNSTLLLRVPLLALLLLVLGINYLVSNFLTLVALFLLRFLISDRFIWKADTALTTTAAAPPATRARPAGTRSPGVLPFRYQVGGFVSVASEIRLRELEYFRVRGLDGDPDIRVRVRPVGEPGLRSRAVVTHGQSFVTYEEHLGQRGANFRLDFEDHQARPLDIRTVKGSKAFANPTVTLPRAPSGARAAVVTLFLPDSGAVRGEAGELVYYKEYGPRPASPTR